MKKLVFGLLVLLLVSTSLFAACSTSTTSTQVTQNQTQTSTRLVAPMDTKTATTATGKWWDKLGVPQYGGEITVLARDVTPNFDPYTFMFAQMAYNYEGLFYPDWTVDRAIWPMAGGFTPEKYFAGQLAERWEMTDQQTMTIYLRQGVRWQNKAPVNGREFTSEDVVFHFDRLLGTGHGYSAGSPYSAMMTANWEKVTAVDKYTVQIHFKNPCGGVAFFSVSDQAAFLWFEAPEWVALGGPPPAPASPSGGGDQGGGAPGPAPASGPLADWQNVVGTGPWILSDFVSAASETFSKNPTYWGHDPRYPQNQTPYADTLKMLSITDTSTQVAALRTGKIDILGSVDWQHAQSLSTIDLQKAQVVINSNPGLLYRNDLAPFSDIKVRKALDMAIDRKEIAKSLYNGLTDGTPCGLVTQIYKGYAYDYNDWPQSLKDEYAYNPTKAKQLLTEAGYPNGFATNCVISSSTTMAQLMQVFKSYFHDIGVEMEIRPMEQAAFSNFVRAAKHDAMSEAGVGNDWPPTRSIEGYYSKSNETLQGGLNQKPDTVYDAAREKFWSTTTPEEAAKAIVEADKRVIEQHYGVYMNAGSGYNFWQPYLKGYSNEMIFWHAQILYSRLWVDSALKKSMGR